MNYLTSYGFLVLTLMILGHLLADYPLQGWLAQSKAKSYWEKSPPKNQYDYIAALACHSFMWTIIVMLPIIYISYFEITWFWLSIPINTLIHLFVDNLKANKKAINLWQDQLIHLFQIVVTWLLWFIFVL